MRRVVRHNAAILTATVAIATGTFALFAEPIVTAVYGLQYAPYVYTAPILALQTFVSASTYCPSLDSESRRIRAGCFSSDLARRQ